MSKYIVISYYTCNTPYEDEVKILIESLKRFNLEYDIQAVDPGRDWQESTRMKAPFILEMVKKHKDRSLVWMDADSVLKNKPIFLDMIDADAAFYYRTDGGRVPRIPEDCELISAAMYFEPNEYTEMLLKMWIEENKKNERDLEQHKLMSSMDHL